MRDVVSVRVEVALSFWRRLAVLFGARVVVEAQVEVVGVYPYKDGRPGPRRLDVRSIASSTRLVPPWARPACPPLDAWTDLAPEGGVVQGGVEITYRAESVDPDGRVVYRAQAPGSSTGGSR